MNPNPISNSHLPEPLRIGIAAMGTMAAQKDAKFDRPVRAPTPLFTAVQEGDIDTVERLLAEGADPNATTFFGLTPLSIAARVYSLKRGSFQCAERWSAVTRLLLEAGADPLAKDFRGSTAASWSEGFVPPPLRDALIVLAERGVWLEDDRASRKDDMAVVSGPASRTVQAHEKVSTAALEAMVARAAATERAARRGSRCASHKSIGAIRNAKKHARIAGGRIGDFSKAGMRRKQEIA